MNFIIQATNLSRSVIMGDETLQILKDLSFEVVAGEWLALTGPSGSGKSTLLGLLAAIDNPTSGKISFDGQDISSLPEKELARLRNEKIGIVFQSFNLISTLTAQENVELPLYVSNKAQQARQLAREMLDLVGLSERFNHRPHQLSGGQQQRVAIARALVNQPKLLLADEPTGNLDTKTGEQMLELFEQVRKALTLTMIVVTHDTQVASRADRVLHLVDGRFVHMPEQVGLYV